MTVGLLVLASITIITLDYRGGGNGVISGLKRTAHDAFAPVQQGVDDVVRPVGSFLAGALHYGSVSQQNERLRQEVGGLQRQLESGQADRQALATLEKLDHLRWVGSTPTVTAQVVALNPSDFSATVQLDKGTRDGVETGMPVVGGAGLVGQVTEAWSTGSYVRLITDAGSTVGVRFGSDPTYADVSGEGAGKALSVGLVPPATPGLTKGEVLTTSGLPDASYPPDVPVARIKAFSSTPSSTQEAITAEPMSDVSALQYVDVMLWEPAS